MNEKKKYKNEDLVLKVNNYYDHTKLNLDDWDLYLDILCGSRNYQKQAILNAIIYLGSGNYKTIEDLIKENAKNNYVISDRYGTLDNYLAKLQITNKLVGNIDLATGTGKSYVIFGIALMMMGLGFVDKVLVLCPSTTIEDGLKEKFDMLAVDNNLIAAIPESSKLKIPRIINGNSTIENFSICIENVHSIYDKTGSSIKDSITNGARVLVLNDESHHIYNSTKDKDIKKWREFLISPLYNFKYILGFTGTAYKDNDYFNDVIYRYSLRQAIDDRIIKDPLYAIKDDTIGDNEKFQKIYQNHIMNKEKYPLVKPLSIFVAADINNAENLKEDFIEFLINDLKMEEKEAREKVLIIHNKSSFEEKRKLKGVDDKNNKVEWIFSVSMLTEGWDAKNVFQIIPWKDRAFNSKLLISQVLGRGLRIPPEYIGNVPQLKIFNHISWSNNIKELFDEIIENDIRIASEVITSNENFKRDKYNFVIRNINYDKIEKEVKKDSKGKTVNFDTLLKKGFNLVSQVTEVEKGTSFISTYNQSIQDVNYLIRRNIYSVDEVVEDVWRNFFDRDWEGKILKLDKDKYTQNCLPSKDVVKSLILDSMRKVGITGEFLTEKNRNIVLTSFGPLLRKSDKTTVIRSKAKELYEISTTSIDKSSISITTLKNDNSLFYTNLYQDELDSEKVDIINNILSDESRSVSMMKQINYYNFKTPQDVVIAIKSPERKFIELLCNNENSNKIEAWVKSGDTGFYSLEYSIRKGSHSKTPDFNPDFFIKVSLNDFNYILVIEIKEDKDDCDENKAKYKYAKLHFDKLNSILAKNHISEKYIFHFLSPESYSEFFVYLRDNRIFDGTFKSDLESLLEEK